MIQKYFILIFIILYSCKQESIDENIKLDGDLLNDNVLNITPDGSEKYLNFNSDSRILFILAHPDDEVLGCGGSIAKWAKDGHKVHILIMAEGVTSRYKRRDRTFRTEELSLLVQSTKKATDILGVESVELLDYPDNRMDSIDLLDVVKEVEKKNEELKALKAKEIANGRLAMVAALGCFIQYDHTGVGPVENLTSHLSNPSVNNVFKAAFIGF